MNSEHVLAVDLGTGSCRAVIFDAAGRQAGAGQREWSHPAVPGVPGSQVFDTAANWMLVCACVREALQTSGLTGADIAAVSTSSMREGMVLYDASNAEIWACPNVDSRASVEASELIASGAADRIYDVGGDWVSITAPARLRWIAKHQPEVFGRVAHLTMLSDWVVQRLTGVYVTDPSIGSSSALFDLEQRYWSSELLELVGLGPDVVPAVSEPGTIVGEVSRAASSVTGLATGTPVVLGGADTQLSLVGLGVGPGDLTVVGGSFWQTTAVTTEPVIDPKRRLRTLCHAVPGEWMVEGIGFYCGITMRWLRDAFCQAEKAAATERGVDPYLVMEEAASTVPPGANGVIGIFSNIMDARRWVQSTPAFLQFDVDAPEQSGRPECIRAVQESAAFATRGHVGIVKEVVGFDVPCVVFTGGAAKGALWPQILADTLGTPVRIPTVKESTALGAAMLAATAVGVHRDLGEAAQAAVRFERTVHPQAAATEAYDRLYPQWQNVYARMLRLTEEAGLRPMWWPAGA